MLRQKRSRISGLVGDQKPTYGFAAKQPNALVYGVQKSVVGESNDDSYRVWRRTHKQMLILRRICFASFYVARMSFQIHVAEPLPERRYKAPIAVGAGAIPIPR